MIFTNTTILTSGFCLLFVSPVVGRLHGELLRREPSALDFRPASQTTKIAAGETHGLFVEADGTVWMCGIDGSTRILTSAPTQVKGLGGIVAIAAGGNHSFALKSDGTLWAWGDNFSGELGDGTTTYRDTPVRVSVPGVVVAIATNRTHSLAVRSDGTVWSWGKNGSGQLGGENASGRLLPAQVDGITDVQSVATGVLHSVALKSDGTVWTWGDNTYGQLGDGTTRSHSAPMQLPSLTAVTAISANGFRNLALLRSGSVSSWGDMRSPDSSGGSLEVSPAQITGLMDIVSISSGWAHELFVQRDGAVWARGDNAKGQVGDGTTLWREFPIKVEGISGVIQAAGGFAHSIALTGSGVVYTWGDNGRYPWYRILGDGTRTDRVVPIPLVGLPSIVAIAAGAGYSVAVDRGGRVWSWGKNDAGQLGDGTRKNRNQPTMLDGSVGLVAVSAGETHTVALDRNGMIWAWGSNSHGQVSTSNPAVPGRVPSSGIEQAIEVRAGSYHTLAATAEGSVWAWGLNGTGQLGDGTTNDRYSPVRVGGLSGIIAIAAGDGHSLALKNDGSVWAWGLNHNGQLGDGTTTDRYTPNAVRELSGVVAISAGGSHSLALKADGTVWAWGNSVVNTETSNDLVLPMRATNLTDIVGIATAQSASLALRTDGTVWAWGSAQFSQIGDGTSEFRRGAVQVGVVRGAVALCAGSTHNLALRADGSVLLWGDNYDGQIGDGTSGIKPIPVALVPPGSADLSISMTHEGIGDHDLGVGTRAAYLLSIRNVGSTSSSGEVTVVDNIPPGLVFAGSSGNGWTCQADGQITTCINSAPIQPSSSSTLTLNVDVLPGAYPGVTNIATGSNESDLNISNNTTGDPLRVTGTGCVFGVTPTSVSLPASGGTAVVAVQTDASCSWMVYGLPPWITVLGTSLGTGPADVTLVVSANTGAARIAGVNIAGGSITVTQGTGVCLYLLSSGGRAFPAAGGAGSVDVITSSSCAWTASNSQSWISFIGSTSGTGNGRVAYQVAPNSTGSRRAVLNIAGQSYGVEQAAASIPGLAAIGSFAQVASAGFWTTTFTIVNMGATTAQVRVSTYDDNGTPLQLPLSFPQNLQNGPILASTLDRTLAPGASLLISTTGPDASPVQTGWAQVSSDGTIAAHAVLRLAAGGTEQEAVVPLEIRIANSLVLAFDNTGGYATGVALANLLAQAGSISLTIKDDAGLQLQTTSLSLPIQGHAAFDLGSRFPSTAQKRGTVEFRSGRPGQLSVLGLRFNPKGAFTTIPPAVK